MTFYKGGPPMQESVILSNAKPGCRVFLASNPLDPLILYNNNVANMDSG